MNRMNRIKTPSEATVDREPGPGVSLNMDKWDGYPLDRQRLLDCIESRGKKDAVILTG